MEAKLHQHIETLVYKANGNGYYFEARTFDQAIDIALDLNLQHFLPFAVQLVTYHECGVQGKLLTSEKERGFVYVFGTRFEIQNDRIYFEPAFIEAKSNEFREWLKVTSNDDLALLEDPWGCAIFNPFERKILYDPFVGYGLNPDPRRETAFEARYPQLAPRRLSLVRNQPG